VKISFVFLFLSLPFSPIDANKSARVTSVAEET